MIKIERNSVKLKGSVAELLAETTMLLRGMKKSMVQNGIPEGKADEMLNTCLEDSRKSQKDIMSDILELLAKKLGDDDAP